jgi:hypothetical protein
VVPSNLLVGIHRQVVHVIFVCCIYSFKVSSSPNLHCVRIISAISAMLEAHRSAAKKSITGAAKCRATGMLRQ